MLDLAATLTLWQLAAEDANPCYLASVAAAVLLDQLLQVGTRQLKVGVGVIIIITRVSSGFTAQVKQLARLAAGLPRHLHGATRPIQ